MIKKKIATFVAAALAASLVSIIPSTATAQAGTVPGTTTMNPVTGQAVPAKAKTPNGAARTVPANPKVTWPTASSITATPVVQSRSKSLAKADESLITPPKVEVFDRTTTSKAKVNGVVLKVDSATPTDVTLDYSGFAQAYGGDWSSRLRLVQLPACAATTPDKPECQTQTPMASTNNATAKTVTAKAVTANAVMAATASSSGGEGDYTATSLAASASWQVSTATGGFSWSYPIAAPSVPGGLIPSLSLSYNSQAVDGHTASTNNQTSWVGEGWDLTSGYVERQYRGCADDGNVDKADQCWAGDNATIVLNGQSSTLIYDDAKKTWVPSSDNSEKVEHLTGAVNGDNDGEYWRVTTTDGTQYYFGVNHIPGWATGNPETQSTWTTPVYGNNDGEPCHASTFDASRCQQAWRWNLDYVVDPHNDSMVYYYNQETNNYGAGLTYTRGGTLAKITYGSRAGKEFSDPAQGQVLFTTADRCVPGSSCNLATASDFPDVPVDQRCTTATCTQTSPTFWSTKRLSSIDTQVYDGSKYIPVDSWSLNQTFPDPGDASSAALWLSGITHTGKVGGDLSLPQVVFKGVTYHNRIDTTADGLTGLPKYRINAIENETGGTISVNYADANCTATTLPTPESNGTRCYPVTWTPKGGQQRLDWFNKYVVSDVQQSDGVGGNFTQSTSYSYNGAAAWHWDTNPLTVDKYRNYNDWRGYSSVTVTSGKHSVDQVTETSTKSLFYRGMNGDRLPSGTRSVQVTDSQGTSVEDSDGLAGSVRETTVYNGTGSAVVSTSIADPYRKQTASHSGQFAYQVRTGNSVTKTALSAGGFRTTRLENTYDDQGFLTKSNDLGDTSIAADDRCSTTTYARNTDKWILGAVSETISVGVACGQTPSYPGDALSDSRSYFDGQAFGVAPTIGNITTTDLATSYSGSTPAYTTQSTSVFDDYGRVTSTTDVRGAKTTTSFTPATGIATSSTVTNALTHAATTTVNVERGQTISVVDPNNLRTDVEYDPLGRLTQVWKPGRLKSNGDSATAKYAYTLSNTTATTVQTSTLNANGNYTTGYTYYDGFLRQRQTKTPSNGGNRVVTDTYYDSAGRAYKTNPAYYSTGAPGTGLSAVKDSIIVSQNQTIFDGAGRATASVLLSNNTEKWRSTTTYGGDHVDSVPPDGGTSTTTYTDARGQTTELRQYKGNTAAGDFLSTKYAYTKAGKQSAMTDAAGNKWSWTYDVVGNQVTANDPDKGAASMTYDASGSLMTSTDSRGKTLAYAYDVLGRKTGEYDGSTTGTQLALWKYDTIAKGKLYYNRSFVGSKIFTNATTTYDTAGRATTTKVNVDAVGNLGQMTNVTTTTYRPDGSPNTVSIPGFANIGAEKLTYTYDDLARPKGLSGVITTSDGVIHDSVSYVDNASYTELSQVEQLTLGAAGAHVWTNMFYDDVTGRVNRSRTVKDGTTPTAIVDANYTYNQAGGITQITDSPDVGGTDTQCFSYDTLQRLTSAWTPSSAASCAMTPTTATLGGPAAYWQDYSYDVTGNRSLKTEHATKAGNSDTMWTSTYSVAGGTQPHAVSKVTASGAVTRTDSYGYDSTGNTSTRTVNGTTTASTWDSRGKMTADGGQSNIYDADGNLLIRQDSAGDSIFLAGQVFQYRASTKTYAVSRYYSFGGQTVAVRTGPDLAGVSWLAGDLHDTSSTSVKASDLSVTRKYTDPFGLARGTAAALPGVRGFVGGYSDGLTSLTHLGARDYDPALGRFTSVDPILNPNDPQSLNGYSYSSNNPVNNSDPTGLLCSGPDGMSCGGSPGLEGSFPQGAAAAKSQWQSMQKSAAAKAKAGKSANAAESFGLDNFGLGIIGKKGSAERPDLSHDDFNPNAGFTDFGSQISIGTEYTAAMEYICSHYGGDACTYWKHYLGASGSAMQASPNDWYASNQKFAQSVQSNIDSANQVAIDSCGNSSPCEYNFSTQWLPQASENGTSSENAFHYGVGSFEWKARGVIHVTTNSSGVKTATTNFGLEVYKNWNFDKGKAPLNVLNKNMLNTNISINVSVDGFARMPSLGMAREYVVSGTSSASSLQIASN
jgi:RHS repeat-associated protein